MFDFWLVSVSLSLVYKAGAELEVRTVVCLLLGMRLLRCATFGGSDGDRNRRVQELLNRTQHVVAGELPVRVRNMLLTCCCFAQKLLEVQTVVGLLLGGGWQLGG